MRDSFRDILSKQSSSEDMEQKKSSSESLERSSKTALNKQVGGNHYKNMPIQVVEFCQLNNLNTCESNVIKYIVRHRLKGGVEDVDKAIHYAELLKQLEYPADANEAKEEWTD